MYVIIILCNLVLFIYIYEYEVCPVSDKYISALTSFSVVAYFTSTIVILI